MRYAIVENGVVTNVLRGEAPAGAVQIPDGVYVTMGYLYDGETFSPPPVPTAAELEAEFRESFVSDKKFRAKCLSDLAFRLNKAPGSVTIAEIDNERDRLAAIYRAL